MNAIIKNLETLKLELHFEKSEYAALTDAQKSELKSAYLWSNYGKCWVSRAKEPNTYRAEKVAEKLGFSGLEKVGERLTYAEQLDRKAERAEARADRYEEYAENARARGAAMQKPLESMRGDIAFFTQPIIPGHSGSQAFARQREKMFERYGRGFDEYRKSDYFQDRATTARATAQNTRLKDLVYLDNRIKECGKNLRDFQGMIVKIEEVIYRLEQGEEVKSWNGAPLTMEGQNSRLVEILERYEAEQDKLNFFEDCMNSLGGVKFSRENIKPGYIVEMDRWGKCEIVSAGPVNVTYKILANWSSGGVLTDSYAAIVQIIAEQKAPEISNPYAAGDVLTLNRMSDGSVYRAFQVLKTTDKGVQLQEIDVVKCTPQPGQFLIGSKPLRKGITKSKFSEFVGCYFDNWQMNKWAPSPEQSRQ